MMGNCGAEYVSLSIEYNTRVIVRKCARDVCSSSCCVFAIDRERDSFILPVMDKLCKSNIFAIRQHKSDTETKFPQSNQNNPYNKHMYMNILCIIFRRL